MNPSRKEERVIIKRNETLRLIGKENFRMDRPRLILCSLAINLLSLALPILTLQVYDRIIANGSQSTLNVLAVGVGVAIILESALRLSRFYVTSWAGAAFEHKISCEAVRHITRADISNVEKQNAGEYLNRVDSIGKLREFYSGYALMTLIDLPFVALFIGLMAYLAGSLVIVPVVMLVLFIAFAANTARSVKNSLAQRDVEDEQRYNFILETLAGIHTIKSSAFEAVFMRKYEFLQRKSSEANYFVSSHVGSSINSGYLFSSLMSCAIVAFGSIMAIEGQLTMGALVACVLLSTRIMQPFQRAMALWSRYQDFRLSHEHVDSLFQLPITLRPVNHNNYTARGSVEVNNISYSYGKNHVFDRVSLNLKPGDCVSISSSISNGKTTLLKLLSGVYVPSIGTIKIDGVDPSTLHSEELVNHIGYLPTQGVIYRGTIFENLTRFGKTPADKVYEICSLLGIDNLVSKMPDGYNTMLEATNADNIPPGLKQRIAMARVLACKPRIILFDNADRALDKDGYNEIYRLFGRLKGRVTLVVISSDKNLLRLADSELVLSKEGLVKKTTRNDGPSLADMNFKEIGR